MDPEQTFLRVHARLSGMLSQLLTPRIRLALEYFFFAVAVVLLCLLVVMHTNFVQQPGCSSEFSGVPFDEAQLVQIKIVRAGPHFGGLMHWSSTKNLFISNLAAQMSQFWSTWLSSGARRGNLLFKALRDDKEFLDASLENDASHLITDPREAHILDAKEGIRVSVTHILNVCYGRVIFLLRNAKWIAVNANQLLISRNLHITTMDYARSSIVWWFQRRSKSFDPTYLYAIEKGYFLLSDGAKAKLGVKTINITISAQSPCFGNRWQQLLISRIVGYDTILTNSLLTYPGNGYLYNFQTKEFYDLSYGHEPEADPMKFGEYFVAKCGVLIMSLFVFFTTTMSVSFTLRETQARMLKFTVQLQHHARHQLPTFQLIFVHVIESLVFVPIMIGILFFLFEFYHDQLLAFLVLTLVWLCEVFTMISVRTSISMQFFPRFFLLYFLVFHIYFFSYSRGFSYLAFSSTAAFMQHLILYFWNRFEVPALQRFIRNWGQFQQQTGMQIMSSSIYTSTLRIQQLPIGEQGGVDRSPELSNNGSDIAAEPINADEVQQNRSTDASDIHMNNPQTGNTSRGIVTNTPHPFSSLLLWLLGGGSAFRVSSFFSMFRDAGDQGQEFAGDRRVT